MPSLPLALTVLGTAYLLGSIPFGYLLVRFVRKEDIRAVGSGNIGATNVARSGAKGLGILTLALDLSKGLIAVMIAKHVTPNFGSAPSDLAVAAAVAAVVGHVFPVWLRFRGGKGVATALGVFLALTPTVALATVVVFALLVATTRIVSLASIGAAAIIPLFAMLLVPDRSPVYLGGVVSVALLVIVKHRANIERLLNHTEPKFGSKGSSSPVATDASTKGKARA